MRFSVGTDIVDIEKLRGSYARWGQKFIARVLTENEYRYCREKVNFLQSVAGRIACKEAAYKALYQLGASGISWKDFEVLDGPTKAPTLNISSKVKKRLPRYARPRTRSAPSFSPRLTRRVRHSAVKATPRRRESTRRPTRRRRSSTASFAGSRPTRESWPNRTWWCSRRIRGCSDTWTRRVPARDAAEVNARLLR